MSCREEERDEPHNERRDELHASKTRSFIPYLRFTSRVILSSSVMAEAPSRQR